MTGSGNSSPALVPTNRGLFMAHDIRRTASWYGLSGNFLNVPSNQFTDAFKICLKINRILALVCDQTGRFMDQEVWRLVAAGY